MSGGRLRRRAPFVVVAALVAVVAAVGGVLAASSGGRVRVLVRVGSEARPVAVERPATVARALQVAGVEPRAGRLLSLVTKSVLVPDLTPASLRVAGAPASLATPLGGGAEVVVDEPPDQVEAVEQVVVDVPAPGLPAVENELWHPGRPGKAMIRRGAVSQEEAVRTELVPPVPARPVTEPWVALTFDDGPWPGTNAFLDVLKAKDAKAMFCVVGYTMGRPGYADVLRRMVAEGHSLCNHSVSHDAKLPTRPVEHIRQEIEGCDRMLAGHGLAKPLFYRPPGGHLSDTVVQVANANGQRVLKWSADTMDYQRPNAQAIVDRAVAGLRPGAVILMHDGGGDRGQTLLALGAMIDRIRQAGYHIVLPDRIEPATAPAAPA